MVVIGDGTHAEYSAVPRGNMGACYGGFHDPTDADRNTRDIKSAGHHAC